MTTSNQPYPIAIRGELVIPPSRWVWIFKWLLGIPHYFILCFLWIAAVFCWIGSFFAIWFTGKYPRSLFDYNVGVMRWSWRVWFYSYGALGTDKYPPFSLELDQSYPADLDVQYPEKLNNWLIFVKWILGLPHWIIVGVFQGNSSWARTGLGLVPILSIVAGIIMLFNGKYPEDIFNLIIGLNRWSNRFYGYLLLMTDRYPPFRLEE